MELINTLEAPGEFDALGTLRPGEPYFLLVGRDRFAPGLVQSWAEQNRSRALADAEAGRINDEQLATELRKSTQAEQIGWSMTSYKRGQSSPDLKIVQTTVTRTTPSYTGHKLPPDTQRRDRLRSAQARAVAALHNAIAEVEPLVDMLEGMEGQEALNIVSAMEAATQHLTPARPGIEQDAAE